MQPKNVNPNDKRTERLALGEEQRRLELCLTSAGLGLWTYNMATDEFWANDRAKHLHGHEPHEVHTFAEAGANIHPEDRDRAQVAIAEAIQTCSKLQIEYRAIWRDGSIRWLASQAEFVPSGEPGEGMFYGSVQDISDRKRIEGDRKRHEVALAASEEKYRSLFNSIDEAFAVCEIIVDSNGAAIDYQILNVNPAFEQMTGITPAIAAGKTARELIPNIEAWWIETYARVALQGETVRFENRVEEMDRWFNAYASPVGEPGKGKFALVFQDITDRKRAEDERKRAKDAMRAFFSNVSHEFRTPLTLLLSLIQETSNDPAHPLSSAQRSQLELAQRNAMRLLKLVNTLLDVSCIEAGRIQAMYEPTDLATLTTELASSFESAIAQAGLHLAIDCPPLPELVYVDRSMWEKIVLNLVSNAFKFTFAGEIAVRLGQAGSQVELTVEDMGIGIAAAELPRLFERFYQVKGAKGRSYEGSGIGLSLVQELVKLHGGTIQVSSVEGEGSCFKVSIPTGFAHLPPERIGSPKTISSTATEVNAYVEEALGWLPEERNRELRIGNRQELSTPITHYPLPITYYPFPPYSPGG